MDCAASRRASDSAVQLEARLEHRRFGIHEVDGASRAAQTVTEGTGQGHQEGVSGNQTQRSVVIHDGYGQKGGVGLEARQQLRALDIRRDRLNLLDAALNGRHFSHTLTHPLMLT